MKHDDPVQDAASLDEQPHAESTFATLATPLVHEALEQVAAIHAHASPESLHQLRVALRRLRSLWWAYAPLLDREESTRHRALYRYLADAAGKTRDWDILLELLAARTQSTQWTGGEGIAAEVPAGLLAEREKTLAASRETLMNADIRNVLHDALADASKQLNTAPERHALQKFAAKRVRAAERSLRKRMRAASHAKRKNYDAMHDVRKAGKKVRYLLEFFGPVLDVARHEDLLKRLRKLQQCFGELNDVIASMTLLRENESLFGDAAVAHEALAYLKRQRKQRQREAARLLAKA